MVYPTELITSQIDLCKREGGEMVLEPAAIAPTRATLTFSESKHLCQRGADGNALSDVLGAP